MVWTHSANTFLDARLQHTAWYHELTYYHGLIAPAFFWIAGFVRAHVTWAAPKPALPALKRLLMVLLIGHGSGSDSDNAKFNLVGPALS